MIVPALLLCLSLSSFTSGNTIVEEVDDLGRQCCTKTTFDDFGNSVSITACAGWFLSNDANALNRACAKVDEAMENMN